MLPSGRSPDQSRNRVDKAPVLALQASPFPAVQHDFRVLLFMSNAHRYFGIALAQPILSSNRLIVEVLA